MLIELYIFFEIITIALFMISFFLKNEILWAITLVFSGLLMFTSWNVEMYVYTFNTTTTAYDPIITTHNYPYLMAINMLFFALAVVLGLFDIFDKYGSNFISKKKQ